MGALGEALVGYVITKNMAKGLKGLTKMSNRGPKNRLIYDKRMFLRR